MPMWQWGWRRSISSLDADVVAELALIILPVPKGASRSMLSDAGKVPVGSRRFVGMILPRMKLGIRGYVVAWGTTLSRAYMVP
ncbi:hypothetical protein GW17_00054764 [Ensete ventricosum]|nr:hypothetical protein GW17_00054764 [Ensete ventricosum]